MSEESDPTAITNALTDSIDAFNEQGIGIPTYEDGIDTDADWKTQLTKGCRLLRAVSEIPAETYYTASIELCFGAIERSLEAFALSEGGNELAEFHDHTYCYERAAALGLLSRETADRLEGLYDENRTDSYYGGKRPTVEQAEAIQRLADEIHRYVTDQLQEGGVCTCDR